MVSIKFNIFKKNCDSVFKNSNLQTQYRLLQKTECIPISKYPDDLWGIPEGAKYYTVVKVGRKDNPNFKREITTFYDDKNIISRCRKGTGIRNQIRSYQCFSETVNDTVNTRPKHSNTRIIRTEEYFPEKREFLPIQEEEQYIYNNTFLDKDGVQKKSTKLHINKNKYSYDYDVPIIHSTMTEYPENYNREPQISKKVLGADMIIRKNIPFIVGNKNAVNVPFPQNDTFLPYRFLMGEQKQISLTQYFLKEKHLENLGINIYVSPYEVGENAVAHFDPEDGNIVFKEVYRKKHPVRTAAHEAEHAFHHSMIGRLGKGRTNYERKCERNLEPLSTIEEIEEGFKYLIAKENYPKLPKSGDLSQNMEYKNNYLEVCARNAAKKAGEKYDEGRAELISYFPFIAGKSTV